MHLQVGMRLLLGIVAGLAGLAPAMVQAVERDDMIATSVARALTAQGRLRGCDLAVSVANGAVQLEGTVRNQDQARTAVSAARGVAGVREVIDRLQIGRLAGVQRRPSPPPSPQKEASPVKQAVYQVSEAPPPRAGAAPLDGATYGGTPYRSPTYDAPTHEMPPRGPLNYQLEHGHRWSGAPTPCCGPYAGHRSRGAKCIPAHRVLHKLQWWPACPGCPISHMTPLGSSWGYYPTCWRQWPPCAPRCPPAIPPEAYLPVGLEAPRAADDGSLPPEMLPAPETPGPADQPPDAPVDPKKGPGKSPRSP